MIDILQALKRAKKIISTTKEDSLKRVRFFDKGLLQMHCTNGRVHLVEVLASDEEPINGVFEWAPLLKATQKTNSLLIRETGHGRFELRNSDGHQMSIANRPEDQFPMCPEITVPQEIPIEPWVLDDMRKVALAADDPKSGSDLAVVHCGEDYVEATCRFWHARAYVGRHVPRVGLRVPVEALGVLPARDARMWIGADKQACLCTDGVSVFIPHIAGAYPVTKAFIPEKITSPDVCIIETKPFAKAVEGASKMGVGKTIALMHSDGEVKVTAYNPSLEPYEAKYTASLSAEWIKQTSPERSVLMSNGYLETALKMVGSESVMVGFPPVGNVEEPLCLRAANLVISIWQTLPNREFT
jgi:hypothetical protein